MYMSTEHTHDGKHRRHGMSPRTMLRTVLVLFIFWGLLFWLLDKYGQWGKVLLETLVATAICMVILIIIRNIYTSNRRLRRSKKNSLFMQLHK